MGNVSGLSFNFWNVMEYAIGFFGGAGMAYGTLTSVWPVAEESPRPHANLVPILFVTLFIPFVVWDQSFVARRFDFVLEEGGSLETVFVIQFIAIALILAMSAWVLYDNYRPRGDAGRLALHSGIKMFFILFTSLYIFLSFLMTGVFVHPLEQYLYLINLLIIWVLLSRQRENFPAADFKPGIWLRWSAIVVLVIAAFAFIASNSHDGMRGSQVRFGNK